MTATMDEDYAGITDDRAPAPTDEHRAPALMGPPRCGRKVLGEIHECALLADHLPPSRGAVNLHVCWCGAVMS